MYNFREKCPYIVYVCERAFKGNHCVSVGITVYHYVCVTEYYDKIESACEHVTMKFNDI